MRTKSRFQSEAEICAAIDEKKADALAKMKEAEDCEAKAKAFFRAGMQEDGRFKTEEAKKLRDSAARVEQRIANLSEALAEFRTIPMAGIVPDTSVPKR